MSDEDKPPSNVRQLFPRGVPLKPFEKKAEEPPPEEENVHYLRGKRPMVTDEEVVKISVMGDKTIEKMGLYGATMLALYLISAACERKNLGAKHPLVQSLGWMSNQLIGMIARDE